MKILKTFAKSVLLLLFVANVFAADIAAPTLRFNWPATGCVPVVENLAKNELKGELHYNLCWVQNSDNRELLTFSYRNLNIKNITNNKGESAPAEIYERLNKILGNIPDFYVRKADGEFAGLEPGSLDKCFDLLAEAAADSQESNIKQVKEIMKNNPEVIAMFEDAAAGPWRAMVEAWEGMGQFGEYVLEEQQMAVSYFPAGKNKYEIKSHNLSTDAYKEYLKKVEKLANSGAEKDFVMPDMKISVKTSVICDQNLRPYSATLYKSASAMANGKQHNNVEIRDYKFHWDKFTPKAPS